MTLWMLRYWLQGYRVVDHGNELTTGEAANRALDTRNRYHRGRDAAIKITDRRWAVMVKGWSARREDG